MTHIFLIQKREGEENRYVIAFLYFNRNHNISESQYFSVKLLRGALSFEEVSLG